MGYLKKSTCYYVYQIFLYSDHFTAGPTCFTLDLLCVCHAFHLEYLGCVEIQFVG